MRVRIYKPARNAMQSGIARTRGWVLVYPAADEVKPVFAQQSLGRGLGADGIAEIICPSRMPSATESWAVLQARSAYTGRTSSVPARRTQVSEHCNGARRLIPAGS